MSLTAGLSCKVFVDLGGLPVTLLPVLSPKTQKFASGWYWWTYVPLISESLENLVYHFFRQQWLVLGVKLMEINSNLFSRRCLFFFWISLLATQKTSALMITGPGPMGQGLFEPVTCMARRAI